MATPKYKQFYELMVQQNQALLAEFKDIHDQFAQGKQEPAFHEVGRDVLDIMRDWERRLCHGMERGQYARYSEQVSEKFWNLIRETYPLIDQVGLKAK